MKSKKVAYVDWKPEENGWKIEQIRALEEEFEKISYKDIRKIAEKFGVGFGNIDGAEKDSLLWTIISDGANHEELKVEIKKYSK